VPLSVPVTLTENATVGLFCIQRYRFLTINQFARIACLHRSTAVTKLRLFEEQGFLGHFGNTGMHAGWFFLLFLLRAGCWTRLPILAGWIR